MKVGPAFRVLNTMIKLPRQSATSLAVILAMTLTSVIPNHGGECRAETSCESNQCCQTCCVDSVNAEQSCCSTPANAVACCCCDSETEAPASVLASLAGRDLARSNASVSTESTLPHNRQLASSLSDLRLNSPSQSMQAILCCWQI